MAETVSDFSSRLEQAAANGVGLQIRGGGSKGFYGRAVVGEVLDTRAHAGIVSYEPSELVVTVRTGTLLADLESTLDASGQMLAFEPPHFGPAATVGGMVACGLSGPRRAAVGAVRDYVLGVNMLNGRGQQLRFGGQVMKNVAGYDVSRLMVGALGTLGLLLEVSMKVLPRPAGELTLAFELSADRALTTLAGWGGKPWPISASCHCDGRLYLRLSGSENGLRAARNKLGGEQVDGGAAFWREVREQTHPFFSGDGPLWRISVPPATPVLEFDGPVMMEWGGAQRWIVGDVPTEQIRAAASRAGGHAVLFRGGDRRDDVFHPLSDQVLAFHKNLKRAFDPQAIFNPGRMYADI